ncbi:hypothetical protein HOY82DRAFT_619440 [Tuber indicum]|nr:hypothetical protein HOY82DRAFT_619440 [Tuber indicum]
MRSMKIVQVNHVIRTKQEAEMWLLPDDFEVFNWCDVRKYLGKNLIIGFVYSQTKILLPPRTNVIHQQPKHFKWIISDQAKSFSEFWTTITTAPKIKGENKIAGKRISGYSSEDYAKLGNAIKMGWLKAEKRGELEKRGEPEKERKSGRKRRTRSKTLEVENQQGKQKARKTEKKSTAPNLMEEEDIIMEDRIGKEQEQDEERSEESYEEKKEGRGESSEEYDKEESEENSEEEDKDESDEEYEEKEEGESDEKDEEEEEDEVEEESEEDNREESGDEGEDEEEKVEKSEEEDGEEHEEGNEEEEEEVDEEKIEEKSKEGGNQEFQKEVEYEVEEREDKDGEKSESPLSSKKGDSGKLVDNLVFDTTLSQSIFLKLARGELEHPLQAGKKWKVPTTWPEDIPAGSSVEAEVQALKEIENTQKMLSAYKFHLQLKVFLKESHQILLSETQEMASLEVKWRKQEEGLDNKKKKLEDLENDLKEMEKEKSRLETELERMVNKEGQLEQLIEKASRLAVTIPHVDIR